MGNGASQSKELHDKKKDELAQLMKVLDTKRGQFFAELLLKRGSTVNEKEVSGGRSVVRQSAMRVATQESVMKQIKGAIGSFFKAAQGGNNGRKAIIDGATEMVGGAIDAIFGVSQGSGMEKRGFTVLFLNFAFVRTDYFVYSYCVSGSEWGMTNSVSGSVQVTDMAVLDPATLSPMEIDYLIAQNLTFEPHPENKVLESKEFETMMQIKVMLATSTILTRIIQDEKTDFETLRITMDQIRQIMDALAGKLAELPEYDEDEDDNRLMMIKADWDYVKAGTPEKIKDEATIKAAKGIDKETAVYIQDFITNRCPERKSNADNVSDGKTKEILEERLKYGLLRKDDEFQEETKKGEGVVAFPLREKLDEKMKDANPGLADESTPPPAEPRYYFGLGVSEDVWFDMEKMLIPAPPAAGVGKRNFQVYYYIKNKDFDESKDISGTNERMKKDPSAEAHKNLDEENKRERVLIIKKQLLAQFKRDTYNIDEMQEAKDGYYKKFKDLQKFQQVGIKTLFGYTAKEWDDYIPSYKAPGREEMIHSTVLEETW